MMVEVGRGELTTEEGGMMYSKPVTRINLNPKSNLDI